jgi:hypothetical protein
VRTILDAHIAEGLYALHTEEDEAAAAAAAAAAAEGLGEGDPEQRDARNAELARVVARLTSLARSFFECHKEAIVLESFAACARRSFRPPTLRTAHQDAEAMEAIVDSAESEMGQALLRDLILSFKLPRSVVGVRPTLLLTREANALATRDHSDVLNAAHDAAMRGALWSWQHDPDRLHQMCALLAGLAIVLTGSADNVRRDDAFGGRVDLPFLATVPPSQSQKRLALCPRRDEWMVMAASSGRSKSSLSVQCRGTGWDGFCQCVLAFSVGVVQL